MINEVKECGKERGNRCIWKHALFLFYCKSIISGKIEKILQQCLIQLRMELDVHFFPFHNLNLVNKRDRKMVRPKNYRSFRFHFSFQSRLPLSVLCSCLANVLYKCSVYKDGIAAVAATTLFISMLFSIDVA